MTKEEFILQAQTEGVTPEVLQAGLDSIIKDSIRTVHTSYDETLKEIGVPKPDGVPTLQHIASVVKGLSTEKSQYTSTIEKLNSQITELSAKTPDIEKLQNDWAQKLSAKDAEIENERNSWKQEKTNSAINGIVSKFKFDPSMKDRSSALAKVEVSEMLGNFSIGDVDGVMVLKKGDITERDEKGVVVTVESYLSNKLSPFFEKEQAPTTPPTKPTGGGAMTFKSDAEKIQRANEMGINMLTAEGQRQFAELGEIEK